MLIGLSGVAGSGKDTCADLLVRNHRFVKVALADEIKRTAQRWFGFTDQQLWGSSEKRNEPDTRYSSKLTPRYVLQVLGTEVGRHIYPDLWIDYTMRIVQKIQEGCYAYDARSGLRFMTPVEGVMEPNTNVVIPDVRWPSGNEGKAIRKAGGKLVRVVRPDAGLQGTLANHASEAGQADVPNSAFDIVIHNAGSLGMLKDLVDSVMIHFGEIG